MSIDNVDSALDIGIISQNVMCDNAFATKAKIAIQLAGADNCVISNSHLEQTQQTSETEAFIYAEEACNCWLQNSYVYYTGRHRKTTSQPKAHYVSRMFEDKKHRRMFIGEDFKTPNHWFKFTGCEFESNHKTWDGYFSDGHSSVINPDSADFGKPYKANYGEYWENCLWTVSTDQEILRLYCINDFPQGITIRNSYLRDTDLLKRSQPPFRYVCNYLNLSSDYCENVCPLHPDSCIFSSFGKAYPWIRFENNIYEYRFSIYETWDKWFFYTEDCNMSIAQFVKLTGSYSSNCHRKDKNGKYILMDNLMV